jgi:hypothetical protein
MDGDDLSLGRAVTPPPSGERAPREGVPRSEARRASAGHCIRLSVARCGRLWAVKHNDGYLGYADSEAEAWSIADHLAGALHLDGRRVELRRG